MLEGTKYLSKRPAFKDMDFLLPRIDRQMAGFLPRPATYGTSLMAIRKVLLEHLPASQVEDFTWHSLRVFMPNWAFMAGVEPHKRQYLGRWTNESTADVYVRSHRNMICDIWAHVTSSNIKPDPGLADIEDGISAVISLEASEPAPATPQGENTNTVIMQTAADLVPPPRGPLMVAMGGRKTGIPPQQKCTFLHKKE